MCGIEPLAGPWMLETTRSRVWFGHEWLGGADFKVSRERGGIWFKVEM